MDLTYQENVFIRVKTSGVKFFVSEKLNYGFIHFIHKYFQV